MVKIDASEYETNWLTDSPEKEGQPNAPEEGAESDSTPTEEDQAQQATKALKAAFDSVQKQWIPYEGPEGGEGWQNASDPEDVRYDLDEPPGEVAEGYEDMAEDWGSGPEDDLPEGRTMTEGELDIRDTGPDAIEEAFRHASDNGSNADLKHAMEMQQFRPSNISDNYWTGTSDRQTFVAEVYEYDGELVFEGMTRFDAWMDNKFSGFRSDESITDYLDQTYEEHHEEDFWRQDDAYHATGPETAASIILDGEIDTRAETRGLGNSGVGSAVFTSMNGGGWLDVYGAVQFEIDVQAMKEDGYQPTVKPEPPVADAKNEEMFAREMGVHGHRAHIPQDMNQDTAVIHGEVPTDYLSLNADQETLNDVESHIDTLEEQGEIESENAEDARNWVNEQRDTEKSTSTNPDNFGRIYVKNGEQLSIETRKQDEFGCVYYEVQKEWIPYEGPRGGEGWQNTNDPDDVRYGLEDAPGKVAEGYEEMAEDWGESRPELSDFSVYASSDSDAYERMQPHLEEIFETGEFDNGAVSTNIRPVTDEDNFDDRWDMDGETPETKSPTALGYLYADTKMPVDDFVDLQEYIGEGLNSWSDGSFYDEVNRDRVESLKQGLTGESVEEYYDGVPIPHVKIGSDGTLQSRQEGRHRAVAAKELGLDEIPVKVIVDPDEEGEGGGPDDGSDGGDGGGDSDFTQRMNEIAEGVEDADNNAKREAYSEIENALEEKISSDTTVNLPGFRNGKPLNVEPTARIAGHFAHADELGILDGLDEIDTLHPTEEAVGQYKYDDQRLSLRGNTNESELEASHERGFSIGKTFESVVLHELGHHAHHQRLEDRSNDVYKKDCPDSIFHIPNDDEGGFKYGMELQDKIEEQVSEYGSSCTTEFVAEVFTGLCLGLEYDDELMKFYQRVGGPEVWKEYRESRGYDEEPALEKSAGVMKTSIEELPQRLRESAQATLESFRRYRDGSKAAKALNAAFGDVQKQWIPYEGPEGGEGWQNTQDRDDIRYDLDEPPGEVAEGYEEQAENWGNSEEEEEEDGGTELGTFLDEIGLTEAKEPIEQDIHSVASDTDTDPEEIAGRLHEQLEQRQDRIGNLDQANTEQISGLANSMLENIGEEIVEERNRDELTEAVESYDDVLTSTKVTNGRIDMAVEDIQEQTDWGRDELRQDLLSHLEEEGVDPEIALGEDEGLKQWAEAKIEEANEGADTPSDVPDGWGQPEEVEFGEWQEFDREDTAFLEHGDKVTGTHNGEEFEGTVRHTPDDGLVGIEMDEGHVQTVETWDIDQYQSQVRDKDEIRQELREHFSNVGKQNKAIEEYTGNAHREINGHMRDTADQMRRRGIESRQRQENAIMAIADEETAQTITRVQASAKRSLPREMNVSRGIDVEADSFLERAEEAMEQGGSLMDEGFQSTTIDQQVAESFGNVTLDIQTDHGVYARAASEFAGEDEILLPAGTQYSVKNVDRENNTVSVEAYGGFRFNSTDVDHVRELIHEEGMTYEEAMENVR